jgi:hypothetical protein
VLSGSASTAVRHLLDGPARTGTVAAVGSSAVYLRVGADLLAVLTSGATRVPCAVVLSPASRLPGSLQLGGQVQVGAGALAWSDRAGRPWVLRPRRWWAPAVVRPGARSAGGSARLRELLRELPRGRRRRAEADTDTCAKPWLVAAADEAARLLAAGQPDDAAERCIGLLGLGSGSTPSGDDAVAGLLLGARALLPDGRVGEGHGPARDLAVVAERVAAAAPDRTSAVSAALLRHAAAGRTVGAVVDAVDVLVDRSPDPHPDDVLRRLLALGHGSGADTATGLLAAADHLPVVP